MRWIVQVVIALDQFVNALFGGWADETLSARAHRSNWTFRKSVFNAAFFWQDDHCRSAYETEQARRHLPAEYRT